MKTRSVRLLHATCVALFALIVPGLVVSAEANSSPKFQLSWTRGAPVAELKSAQEKLKLARAHQGQGNVSKEEIALLSEVVERIADRAPYQFTIQSAGGTLREFIAAASIGPEVSLTLINTGEPADLETPLPAFRLRNVGWSTLLEILGNFLGARGLQLQHGGLGNQDNASSAICILRRVRPVAEINFSAKSEFESFQLGDYLTKEQTVEVIVDAIRTAWTLEPGNDPAALRLKFHPGTQILLVSGPAPAPKIAGLVIAGLRKNPVSR